MVLGVLLLGSIAIIFPPFCALVLAQLVGIPRRDIPVFVLYGLGIGPAILAWIVDVLFRVTPGMPIKFYTFILSLVFVAVVSWGGVKLLKESGDKQL